MKRVRPILILSAITVFLAACTSVGERTLLSVGYYSVSGDTFGELDKEIKLHGPNVTGVGKALASTDLRMLPKIQYGRKSNKCGVTSARVNVQARVTLPRHTNERKLKAELAKAWNNLQEYARVHEAVHLAIADRYALLMEGSILQLPSQDSCNEMKALVADVFTELSKQHHSEQLEFDASEKRRIRQLISQANTQ